MFIVLQGIFLKNQILGRTQSSSYIQTSPGITPIVPRKSIEIYCIRRQDLIFLWYPPKKYPKLGKIVRFCRSIHLSSSKKLKHRLRKNSVLAGPDSFFKDTLPCVGRQDLILQWYPPQNIPSCRVDRPEPLKNQNASSNPVQVSYPDVPRKFPRSPRSPDITSIISRKPIETHCVRKQDLIF